jgi:exodeoxyribonuclease-3
MKICSFNVNSIKARKELVLSWLDHRENDIDVLCFQELKLVEEFFPLAELEDKGFTCEVFGQKAYNGVAICSRSPLTQVQKGFGNSFWDQQSRFISARLGNITLMNLYVPHGGERGEEKFVYKQEWYTHLLAYLDENYTPQDRLILSGDFNVTRADIDVYSAEALHDAIGTMPEERAAFEKLLSWGLIDTFRHIDPESTQYTWWGYMGGAIWKDEGMRIDYILCTEPLLSACRDISVDMWPRKRNKPTPSDHAPLIAEFDFTG